MNSPGDRQLADELEREIDGRTQPGPESVITAEEQDWINTARLALGPLRDGSASDDQRDAARHALAHLPPPRA